MKRELNSINNNFIKNNGFVQLHNVSKNYHTPAGDFLALDNLDLTIREGEFVSIIGKSGSGKSTLINMITGIDHPSSGTVIINGRNIHDQNEGQMALWRGRNMGIVFQFFQLLPMLSVLENTMLPMDFCNQYESVEREKIALDLLQQFGLQELANQYPLEISGGHQQCAAIARALANDPPILIADEPTGNLDSKTAELVLNIFDDLRKREKTVIMVTHDRELAKRADRILILSDGRLISEEFSYIFSNVSDYMLSELDKAKVQLKLKSGDFIPQEWSGKIWFGFIESGLLCSKPSGMQRLFYKERSYDAGVVFKPDSQFESWAAAEETIIWIIPSNLKKKFPVNVIDQVDATLKFNGKGRGR